MAVEVCKFKCFKPNSLEICQSALISTLKVTHLKVGVLQEAVHLACFEVFNNVERELQWCTK